jgi:DNA-binding transcriptional regulator YhcF (GntR family)
MVRLVPTAPLQLAVDRDSELPLGLQLSWKLRARIAAGLLRPGERLPSVRELAASAGVNVNTARAVYGRLEQEGYIESRHGLGTFVAARAGEAPGELGRIASEAASEARDAGLDPRELAAAIYASADIPAPVPELPGRVSSTLPDLGQVPDERAARRTLRRQIARLEAELGAYAEKLAPPEETHPLRLPKPHLTGLAELEGIRDRLLDKLSEARDVEAAEAERRQEARAHLEALVRNPEEHKWQWVSNEELGEPGCKYWYSRPKWGVLGAMMGWWRVKVSSGCPLAGA